MQDKPIIRIGDEISVESEIIRQSLIIERIARERFKEEYEGSLICYLGNTIFESTVLTADGGIVANVVTNVGSGFITNDIAIILGTTITEAERIKAKYGCAKAKLVRKDEMINVKSAKDRKSKKTSRRLLAEIIEARMRELSFILKNSMIRLLEKTPPLIAQQLMNRKIRLVCVGNDFALEGAKELFEEICDLPVEVIKIDNRIFDSKRTVEEKLILSNRAKQVVKRLASVKDQKKIGCIAAVDPQTGEVFYGKTMAEASEIGRKKKDDSSTVFFFVRVGYPAMHRLRRIKLEGNIHQERFPTVNSYVKNKTLHIVSSIPANVSVLTVLTDTGFTGSLVLDEEIIQQIKCKFIGETPVNLPGGIGQNVNVYNSDILVNKSRLKNIEIIEMKGEYIMGLTLMRTIGKQVVFAFDKDEVLFRD